MKFMVLARYLTFFLGQDYRFPDHPKAKIKSSLVEHNPASVSTSRKLMCHKKS